MTRYKGAVLGLVTSVLVMGCNSEQEFVASELSQAQTADSAVVSSTTESLVGDATNEVQTEETCQAEEPDFEAIRESLIAKLTALIAKLEAIDVSDQSEDDQAKHAEQIAELKIDLEFVTTSTELSDELKSIADKFWRKSSIRREIASSHSRGGPRRKPAHDRDCENREPPAQENACISEVRKGNKDAQCLNIEKLLKKDDLSVELRAALEARYVDVCSG